MRVLSQTLEPIETFASLRDPRDYDDWAETDFQVWLHEISRRVYNLLDGKIWVGHDIIGPDVSKLEEAFAKIGKDAPKARSIIDTRLLLSRTKFAKLAEQFGLGNEGCDSYENCLKNINAIKLCGNVMSIFEPDKMKNYVDGYYHPMLSYLMDLKSEA